MCAMSLETILESFGLSEKESTLLVESAHFHHKEKTREEFQALFERVARAYDCSQAEVVKAILAHPPFAGYDHERVVREGTEEYHDEKAVKKAILAHPPFAGLDHERVVRQGTEVYGNETNGNETAVKKAIPTFPPFAGLNHERVVRQKGKVGRIIGISQGEILRKILEKPVLAGYSAKRYLAAIDIGRELHGKGYAAKDIISAFFCYPGKSPYVPETKKLRISHVENYKKPPLAIAMEKYLARKQKEHE